MTRRRPLGLGTHIFVEDADAAVAFYSEAFGAAELVRHRLPDGRVLFVELALGPDKLLRCRWPRCSGANGTRLSVTRSGTTGRFVPVGSSLPRMRSPIACRPSRRTEPGRATRMRTEPLEVRPSTGSGRKIEARS